MKRMMIAVAAAAVLGLINSLPSPAGPNVCHDNCVKCASSCDAGAKALAAKKGDARLVKQLHDCAKICRIYNGTGTHAQEKACADACKACAAACQKNGDSSLKQCISDCHDCTDCCTD